MHTTSRNDKIDATASVGFIATMVAAARRLASFRKPRDISVFGTEENENHPSPS